MKTPRQRVLTHPAVVFPVIVQRFHLISAVGLLMMDSGYVGILLDFGVIT